MFVTEPRRLPHRVRTPRTYIALLSYIYTHTHPCIYKSKLKLYKLFAMLIYILYPIELKVQYIADIKQYFACAETTRRSIRERRYVESADIYSINTSKYYKMINSSASYST